MDESQERWDDLRGPDAILARLRTVEARLERLRLEVAEVGRWADHSAFPDVRSPLKRARELLEDAARQVRHARQRREHG